LGTSVGWKIFHKYSIVVCLGSTSFRLTAIFFKIQTQKGDVDSVSWSTSRVELKLKLKKCQLLLAPKTNPQQALIKSQEQDICY